MQLGEGEGLDHVVVAARVEALDPVVEAVDRRQEKDRRRDAGAAQHPDQPQPVHLRQQAVHDHHVVAALAGEKQPVDARLGAVDRRSRPPAGRAR